LLVCKKCPQNKLKLLYGNFMVCPFCGFLLTNV